MGSTNEADIANVGILSCCFKKEASESGRVFRVFGRVTLIGSQRGIADLQEAETWVACDEVENPLDTFFWNFLSPKVNVQPLNGGIVSQ